MMAAKGQEPETTQRAIGCRSVAHLPMPDLSGHTRESGVQYAITEEIVTQILQHESSFSRRIAPES